MGQKGHIMVQKGLKMYKKGQKIEFLYLQYTSYLAEFSLAELGGTTLPPLTKKNHSAQKTLAVLGGTPRPLGGKNPLSSF